MIQEHDRQLRRLLETATEDLGAAPAGSDPNNADVKVAPAAAPSAASQDAHTERHAAAAAATAAAAARAAAAEQDIMAALTPSNGPSAAPPTAGAATASLGSLSPSSVSTATTTLTHLYTNGVSQPFLLSGMERSTFDRKLPPPSASKPQPTRSALGAGAGAGAGAGDDLRQFRDERARIEVLTFSPPPLPAFSHFFSSLR
jgi:hypothetical protein